MTGEIKKVKVDYGNQFRSLHMDLFDIAETLLCQNKITPKDFCIWVLLCKYMKPYSTEINIGMGEFAKRINKSRGHLSETLKRLIKNKLIIQHNKKLFINLNYATRGNDVYEHIYKICNSDLKMVQELNREKSREEDICYDEAF